MAPEQKSPCDCPNDDCEHRVDTTVAVSPHIDFARFLPQEAPLSRDEHDKYAIKQSSFKLTCANVLFSSGSWISFSSSSAVGVCVSSLSYSSVTCDAPSLFPQPPNLPRVLTIPPCYTIRFLALRQPFQTIFISETTSSGTCSPRKQRATWSRTAKSQTSVSSWVSHFWLPTMLPRVNKVSAISISVSFTIYPMSPPHSYLISPGMSGRISQACTFFLSLHILESVLIPTSSQWVWRLIVHHGSGRVSSGKPTPPTGTGHTGRLTLKQAFSLGNFSPLLANWFFLHRMSVGRSIAVATDALSLTRRASRSRSLSSTRISTRPASFYQTQSSPFRAVTSRAYSLRVARSCISPSESLNLCKLWRIYRPFPWFLTSFLDFSHSNGLGYDFRNTNMQIVSELE